MILSFNKKFITSKKIRQNIYKLDKFDLGNNYSPHISLFYRNHQIKKKRIEFNLSKFNKIIRIFKIVLVEINQNINQ